jgi:hypothetical protein
MSKQTKKASSFWLKWVLLNGIAWLIGLGLVDVLLVGPPIWLWGLLSGLVIGIIQGLVLRHRINWIRWLLVTVPSWFLGLWIGGLFSLYLLRIPVHHTARIFAFDVVFGILGGTLSIILQYSVCWRDVYSRKRGWLFILIVSSVVAGLASGIVVWGVQEIASLFALFALWDVWVLTSSATGGILFGSITGVPLAWLLYSTSEIVNHKSTNSEGQINRAYS